MPSIPAFSKADLTKPPGNDWYVFPGNLAAQRHSTLTQLTPANVGQLRVAWTFNTGDSAHGSSVAQRSGFETTPLLIDGRLVREGIVDRDKLTAVLSGRATSIPVTSSELLECLSAEAWLRQWGKHARQAAA